MQERQQIQSSQVTPSQQEDEGSFFTGFAVGTLVGFCGLFFLGTDKGKKVVKNLEKEWVDISSKLSSEFGKDFEGKTILEALQSVATQAEDFLEKQATVKLQNKHPKPPKKKFFFR
jgi:hypothetical protein